MAAAVCVAASLSAGAVELGPPPGAALSREKLSSIDDFINGEVSWALTVMLRKIPVVARVI
jgi:hypothetical protein